MIKLLMNLPMWPLSLLLAAACLFCSCASSITTGPGTSASGRDPISAQVHTAINNYRKSKGKQPLIRHGGLDRLASQHSNFLLQNSGRFDLHGKKVSHYGFENRVLAARRIHSMDTVAENVVAGRVDQTHAGNALLRLWQGSKDHHKQLLEAWTYTGIGSATGADGTVYCTQIFATLNLSRQQSRDRFAPQ